MSGSMMMVIGATGLALVVLIGMYNSLVVKRNQVSNVFSTVDVLLKKRYDLIPNLVAAVQGYVQHERNTLKELTELRSRALAGNLKPEETLALNSQLGHLLGAVRVAVEAYPDLKASQNFLQLQAALNEVEEQISAGRRAYNAAVTAYNNAVQTVPLNMVAGMFHFQPAVLFATAEADRAVPKVQVG